MWKCQATPVPTHTFKSEILELYPAPPSSPRSQNDDTHGPWLTIRTTDDILICTIMPSKAPTPITPLASPYSLFKISTLRPPSSRIKWADFAFIRGDRFEAALISPEGELGIWRFDPTTSTAGRQMGHGFVQTLVNLSPTEDGPSKETQRIWHCASGPDRSVLAYNQYEIFLVHWNRRETRVEKVHESVRHPHVLTREVILQVLSSSAPDLFHEDDEEEGMNNLRSNFFACTTTSVLCFDTRAAVLPAGEENARGESNLSGTRTTMRPFVRWDHCRGADHSLSLSWFPPFAAPEGQPGLLLTSRFSRLEVLYTIPDVLGLSSATDSGHRRPQEPMVVGPILPDGLLHSSPPVTWQSSSDSITLVTLTTARTVNIAQLRPTPMNKSVTVEPIAFEVVGKGADLFNLLNDMSGKVPEARRRLRLHWDMRSVWDGD